MFLTKEEVFELTGYKYLRKQIEWLAHHGYKFEISKNGHPKILKSFIEHRIGASNEKYFVKGNAKLNLMGLNEI